MTGAATPEGAIGPGGTVPRTAPGAVGTVGPGGSRPGAVVPGWVLREPPLPAYAVLARGDTVPGLAARAAARLAAGAELRVAAAPGWLLVIGADLPWAPGVRYLGRDGGLLVPTTLAVQPSADLLHRALRRRVPADHSLIVAIDDTVLSAPLPARPADPGEVATLR
jgi:hypothetical protein